MITYAPSERLSKIAAKVIAEQPKVRHLDNAKCRIAYVTADTAKKSGTKIVYADTERVKDKLKALVPYDFIITFYWPNCMNLSEEKLERLMYHELRHVGFSDDGSFSIIPHDVEDFRDVIDKWGIDWI